MNWKPPKNTETHYWTQHVAMKMRYYGLSEQRIRRVIRRPERTEEGIAKDTIAVMQPQSTRRDANGEKTWTSEIWVMYQISNKSKVKSRKKGAPSLGESDDPMIAAQMDACRALLGSQKKVKVISAWRYPGKTKPGESLPTEILDEIAEAL